MTNASRTLLLALVLAAPGCPAASTPAGDVGSSLDGGTPVGDGGSGVDAGATAALCIANGLCQAGGPSGPSGFNGPDSCWNGCNWCHCTAAGTISDCTALTCDAGPPTPDAGIDCSMVGCGAPPICGEACDSPCGCCPCADGEEMGTGYVCEAGCWAPRGTGASGDHCTVTSDCGGGLSCCYPCGVPGCTNQCTPTCAHGDPGCVNGCAAVP
jgi:hypothetical protein